MGVYMVVQAFEDGPEKNTRTVRDLFYVKNDMDLTIWFEDHLQRHLEYGPYYEFNHYKMNELIVEYELALDDKGEFANDASITKEECQDILNTLKEYREKRGDKYASTSFLFSQS